MPCAVDDAHAAAAEDIEEFVFAEAAAAGGRFDGVCGDGCEEALRALRAERGDDDGAAALRAGG